MSEQDDNTDDETAGGNIVVLRPHATSPSHGFVTVLEQFMKLAKEDKLHSLAIVGDSEGKRLSYFAWRPKVDVHGLMGALNLILFRIARVISG